MNDILIKLIHVMIYGLQLMEVGLHALGLFWGPILIVFLPLGILMTAFIKY